MRPFPTIPAMFCPYLTGIYTIIYRVAHLGSLTTTAIFCLVIIFISTTVQIADATLLCSGSGGASTPLVLSDEISLVAGDIIDLHVRIGTKVFYIRPDPKSDTIWDPCQATPLIAIESADDFTKFMILPIAVLDPILAQSEFSSTGSTISYQHKVNTTSIPTDETHVRFVSTIELLNVKTGMKLGVAPCGHELNANLGEHWQGQDPAQANQYCNRSTVLIPSAQCTVQLGRSNSGGNTDSTDAGQATNSPSRSPHPLYETIFDLDTHYVNDASYIPLWNTFVPQKERIPLYSDDYSGLEMPPFVNMLQNSNGYKTQSTSRDENNSIYQPKRTNQIEPHPQRSDRRFTTLQSDDATKTASLWDPADSFDIGSFLDDLINSNPTQEGSQSTNPLFAQKGFTNFQNLIVNQQFGSFFNQSNSFSPTPENQDNTIIGKLSPKKVGSIAQQRLDELNGTATAQKEAGGGEENVNGFADGEDPAKLNQAASNRAFITLRLRPIDRDYEPTLVTHCKGVVTNSVDINPDPNTYQDVIGQDDERGIDSTQPESLREASQSLFNFDSRGKRHSRRKKTKTDNHTARQRHSQKRFNYSLPPTITNTKRDTLQMLKQQRQVLTQNHVFNLTNQDRSIPGPPPQLGSRVLGCQIVPPTPIYRALHHQNPSASSSSLPSHNSSPATSSDSHSFKAFQASATPPKNDHMPCTLQVQPDGRITCSSIERNTPLESSSCPAPQPLRSSSLWALSRVPFNDVPTSSLFLSQSISSISYDSTISTTNTYPFMMGHFAMRNYTPFEQFLSSRAAKRFFNSFTIRMLGTVEPFITVTGDGFGSTFISPIPNILNAIAAPIEALISQIIPGFTIPTVPGVSGPTFDSFQLGISTSIQGQTTITDDNESSTSYSITSPPRTFILAKSLAVFGRSSIPFEIMLERYVTDPYNYNSCSNGYGPGGGTTSQCGYNSGPQLYNYAIPALYQGTSMVNNEYLIDVL